MLLSVIILLQVVVPAFKFAFEIANYLGLETKNLLKGMLFE